MEGYYLVKSKEELPLLKSLFEEKVTAEFLTKLLNEGPEFYQSFKSYPIVILIDSVSVRDEEGFGFMDLWGLSAWRSSHKNGFNLIELQPKGTQLILGVE